MDPFSIILFFFSLRDIVTLPQPTKEQSALVKQLGDDSWRKREEASQKLEKIDREALLAIERFGLKNPDLEIARRSERLIDQIYRLDEPKKGMPAIYGIMDISFRLPSGKQFALSNKEILVYYHANEPPTNGNTILGAIVEASAKQALT